MKFTQLLPLAAIGTAFVVPDQELFSSLAIEDTKAPSRSFFDDLPIPHHAWDNAEDSLGKTFKCAKNNWDDAVNYVEDFAVNIKDDFKEAFAGDSWLDSADYETDLFDRPPRRGSPHHGRRPPHKPHHGKPNMTVYELINESKYTTKLAALINEDEELVTLLNGTSANFTLFAPIDKAFDKIPEHHKKPSKEFIKKLLTYHVSTGFYPAGRVLVSRTIPSALTGEFIGNEPQRLSTQISLRGLTINFYARIIAINIFGTNGVIHGLDSILLPPPKAVDIISLLPGEFSTLELALFKTGLFETLNNTSLHIGGTLFAPSNVAFQRLGPKINAFLFSRYGEKYLKALLKYHVVANYTLYSDAFYKGSSLPSISSSSSSPSFSNINNDQDEPAQPSDIPKGVFHVDLPTLLDDKSLSIDVARYARFITIKINGFTNVAIADGIAADGVVHVVPNVLIPPKAPGMLGESAEGMELEEFVERLEPFVKTVEESDEL